jgi:hypothetical protein
MVMVMLMYAQNREPPVEELLEDEIGRLVLARDGLDVESVRAFVAIMRKRLREAAERQPS